MIKPKNWEELIFTREDFALVSINLDKINKDTFKRKDACKHIYEVVIKSMYNHQSILEGERPAMVDVVLPARHTTEVNILGHYVPGGQVLALLYVYAETTPDLIPYSVHITETYYYTKNQGGNGQ